jgi:transposase-like protein
MSKKRKSYSADFKQDAVGRMAHAKTITGLVEELGVRRKFLYLWRDQLQAGGRAALERHRGRPPGSQSEVVSQLTPSAAELRIAELERQCQLAEVSRAGFYRYLQRTAPEQADLLLRARMQELALSPHRLQGYRLITRTLKNEGQVVNHMRVLRLMREDNLLRLRRTK